MYFLWRVAILHHQKYQTALSYFSLCLIHCPFVFVHSVVAFRDNLQCKQPGKWKEKPTNQRPLTGSVDEGGETVTFQSGGGRRQEKGRGRRSWGRRYTTSVQVTVPKLDESHKERKQYFWMEKTFSEMNGRPCWMLVSWAVSQFGVSMLANSLTEANSSIRALTRSRVRTSPAPFAKQMGQSRAACFLVVSLRYCW